jgi:hypothetical protein
MTVTAQIMNITIATARSHPDTNSYSAFDVVTVTSESGGDVKLFLPHETGQAVADAINAAVAK